MGEKPDLSGEITDFDQNRIGSIALWKSDDSQENRPIYKGNISFRNGEKKFRVALWENEKQEEKETLGAHMKFPKNWKLDSFLNPG